MYSNIISYSNIIYFFNIKFDNLLDEVENSHSEEWDASSLFLFKKVFFYF
jgi:hypothetical protein